MTTIFWAGDSTVKQNGISTYPQTGIGQVFDRYTRPFQVLIDNCAENGRSTKSFIDEGRLDAIDRRIREGDFLFIQFGHNDEKAEDPSRYADPDGAFRDNLALFVETARRHGATPVLITPLTRFSFHDPTAAYHHDRWAAAVRETASRLKVALVDLTQASEQLVDSMGEKARTELYMNLPAGQYAAYPGGLADGTHLQPMGAMAFGALIAQALLALGEPYAGLVSEEFSQWLQAGGRVTGPSLTQA